MTDLKKILFVIVLGVTLNGCVFYGYKFHFKNPDLIFYIHAKNDVRPQVVLDIIAYKDASSIWNQGPDEWFMGKDSKRNILKKNKQLYINTIIANENKICTFKTESKIDSIIIFADYPNISDYDKKRYLIEIPSFCFDCLFRYQIIVYKDKIKVIPINNRKIIKKKE